jgi:dTDP-4-dehydrorhamnose reductase
MNGLEIWGGVECTINRVGDAYRNQMAQSGHERRPSDIAAIAALGLRTVRYPVLWEAVAPDGLENADWSWADQRLGLLRRYGIEPIVGLLHHGSGPASTQLLDDAFPERFAEYAGAVAARFPWVARYTPINEPLTTARFSALYGHWYPHARDDRSFVRAVLNQCRATVLAMAAIRAVNPAAGLVQTDDLGRTFSTPALAGQARFDNDRRWLAWDLLCGRVGPRHRLRRFLRAAGTSAAELDWFASHSCPPSLVGVNHYVTSNRYLHQDESWCDRSRWGGNGREAYADTEAVRVFDDRRGRLRALLRQAWQRYRIPLAVTEAHIGCTREEQLRWLLDAWRAAQSARAAGVDVRAVTAWALFGSYDWDSLLTESRGHYEPGAYDVRGGSRPRLTALGRLVGMLARGEDEPDRLARRFPACAAPGWWRRPSRLLPGAHARRGRGNGRRPSGRRILITGASGTLGQALARACEQRGIPYLACARLQCDIADRDCVAGVLDAAEPWALVNTAGYVRVDDAESDRERCFRENRDGAAVLASECRRRGLPLVTFSSDLVFDGARRSPYVESDAIAPLNVYGRSKADAESLVLARWPRALVIRTSAFFGPWDAHNFVTRALETLRRGERFRAARDLVVSPTYVPDLVHAALDLLVDGERGIWHLANPGEVSWHELARLAAAAARVDRSGLVPVSTARDGALAARPRYSALGSERAFAMPTLDDAIARYVAASS